MPVQDLRELQATVDRLRQVVYSGVQEVSHQGNRVRYDEYQARREALADAQRELEMAKDEFRRMRRRVTICYPRLGY
jgi:chloramphenicol 3-O-phosphotransferase